MRIFFSLATDFEGLVTQSLLLANFEAAVEVCLHHNKMAEAITLAIAGGPELLLRTQKRFFKSTKSDLNRVSQKREPLMLANAFAEFRPEQRFVFSATVDIDSGDEGF